MGLRSLFYRLTGKRKLYQIYANVTSSTPDRCLEHHGRIVTRPEQVPRVPGCDFQVHEFPTGKLDDYAEKRTRMEELAGEELRRRELFRQGREALQEGNPRRAVEKFRESVNYDEYVSEIEEVVHAGELCGSEEVKDELREVFIHGYKEKFGLKRYERYPERMREDRKEAGLAEINELFDG